jgi:hypothetical protein
MKRGSKRSAKCFSGSHVAATKRPRVSMHKDITNCTANRQAHVWGYLLLQLSLMIFATRVKK